MNFNFIFNEDNPFWSLSPTETNSPSLTATPNLETIATTITTTTTTNVEGVYLSPPLTNPIYPLDDDFNDFHQDREQENDIFAFFPPLFDLQHQQQQDLAMVDPALFQFNDNDILNDRFFHSAFFNTMDLSFNTNDSITISSSSSSASASASPSSPPSSSSSSLDTNEIISLTTHRPKNRYSCKLCHNDYSRPQDVKRHINSYHNTLSVHDCNKCDRKYRRKDLLKRHIRTKHN
ncbi:unnamed protein product [Cunninghamella echinulata]